ncbi:MAG: Crp/Fnr family transcriptional regulator [Steroidobacteraceae bacterium]
MGGRIVNAVPVECRYCPLRKLGAFSSNSAEEIAFIQSLKKNEVQLDAGAQLFAEGGSTTELYTLLMGWAFRFRTLRDGRRQILNFLLPGDFVGLQEQLASNALHGVETLTTARFCAFPRARLWDLYRNHPSLGYDVTWLAAHEEHIVDENLLTVGRRSAEERVATLLIHLFKRAESIGMKQDDSVPFPINQQHIADALGLSLVHTNKTLRRLSKLGLHQLTNGRLRLINPASLQRLADYYAAPLRGRPLI